MGQIFIVFLDIPLGTSYIVEVFEAQHESHSNKFCSIPPVSLEKPETNTLF